jgi:hypothetical protein
MLLRIPEPGGTYQVAIVPGAGQTGAHSVKVAGLMLEDITGVIVGQPAPSALDATLFPPGYYIATQERGVGNLAVCEDTDGSSFQRHWARGCTQLCPTGFEACEDGSTHCFWSLRFNLNLEGIEHGGQLQHSGFAYGNYNYRLDSLAVNLVGTGLRDCTLVANPSTCYGAGNIPYTVIHYPPYIVRNHRGDEYEAPLYIGRIEHGRGLAAERYISNPISGADRTLLQDYWHRELRGRPITGEYELRIWEDDGVMLGNLEDVQIVMDYRYWTRFTSPSP